MKKGFTLLLAALVSLCSWADDTYKQVTSASELKAGAQVVVVSGTAAMSTTQSSWNRGATTVTIDKTNKTCTPNSLTQIFTLEAGTKAGTWSFSTGSGYICAGSSEDDCLETSTIKTNDASWTISFSGGVATILAQGIATFNQLTFDDEVFVASDGDYNDIKLYIKDSAAPGEMFAIVASLSELAAGDQVIIGYDNSSVAISTAQSSWSRGAAAITLDGATCTISPDVQVFTVEAGTVADTWSFKAENGYICAASSVENTLETVPNKTANASWSITFNKKGYAKLMASGSAAFNVLTYDSDEDAFVAADEEYVKLNIFKKADQKAPEVLTQPNDGTYTLGDSPRNLTVKITAVPDPTFQWYKNTVKSTEGATAIPGATTDKYKPDVTVAGTTYYYCVATNPLGSATTAIATVTVIPATVTVKTDGTYGWATYAAGYNLKLDRQEGVDVFYAQKLGGESTSVVVSDAITKLEGKALAKGTGILIRTTVPGTSVTFNISPKTEADFIMDKEEMGNMLVGVLEPTTYDATLHQNCYIFTGKGGEVGFYPWQSGTIGANKCYLKLEEASEVVARFSIAVDDSSLTTEIRNPQFDNTPVQAYDLSGRAVSGDYKGLVIAGGKKYVK